jgi:hypothetical protein
MCVLALLALAAARPIRAADTPLPDGSFENGPPPASGWVEVINTPTDCSTAISNWASDWNGLAAPAGSLDFWAGGYCDGTADQKKITAAVSQSVTVPNSVPVLKFKYASYRVDTDDVAGNDVAKIAVDGTDTVWSFDASKSSSNTFNGSTGGFVDGKVDLCAYAGQQVLLSVGLVPGSGDYVANVRFDHFRWADGIFLSSFECDLDGWELVEEP